MMSPGEQRFVRKFHAACMLLTGAFILWAILEHWSPAGWRNIAMAGLAAVTCGFAVRLFVWSGQPDEPLSRIDYVVSLGLFLGFGALMLTQDGDPTLRWLSGALLALVAWFNWRDKRPQANRGLNSAADAQTPLSEAKPR